MSYLWLVLKPLCWEKRKKKSVNYQICSCLPNIFRVSSAQQRWYSFGRRVYVLAWLVSITCVDDALASIFFPVPLPIPSTEVPDGVTTHFQPLKKNCSSLILSRLSLCQENCHNLLFSRYHIVCHCSFCSELCRLCCMFSFHVFFFFLQFHRRIYKGIPLQFRGQVWSLLLDVPKMKKEMKDFYNVS